MRTEPESPTGDHPEEEPDMTTLHHRPGCDPRERTGTTCPCGVTDAWADHQQAKAEDHMDREDYEREDR